MEVNKEKNKCTTLKVTEIFLDGTIIRIHFIYL
jgi:hypothetical protein